MTKFKNLFKQEVDNIYPQEVVEPKTKTVKVNVGKVIVKVTHEDKTTSERPVIGNVELKNGKLVGNIMSNKIDCLNPVAKLLLEPYLVKSPKNDKIEIKRPKNVSIVKYEDFNVEVVVPEDFKI